MPASGAPASVPFPVSRLTMTFQGYAALRVSQSPTPNEDASRHTTARAIGAVLGHAQYVAGVWSQNMPQAEQYASASSYPHWVGCTTDAALIVYAMDPRATARHALLDRHTVPCRCVYSICAPSLLVSSSPAAPCHMVPGSL